MVWVIEVPRLACQYEDTAGHRCVTGSQEREAALGKLIYSLNVPTAGRADPPAIDRDSPICIRRSGRDLCGQLKAALWK